MNTRLADIGITGFGASRSAIRSVIGIARSLGSIVAVSVAIVYCSFLGMQMVDNWDGPDPGYHLTASVRSAGRETLGFLSGALGGDLGTVTTVSGERPANDILGTAYKNSLGLLVLAVAAAAAAGFLLGSLAALTGRQRREYTVLMLTLLGISAPSFFVAVLLQRLGIKYTVTFGRRLVSMGGYGWDFQHLAMPVLVLAARPVAHITRTAFVSLSHIMEEDYIRTAFAKGLTRRRTVIVHALRNLAVPVLTAIGVSFRFSLSTLPVVEYVFAWPGMGLRVLEAINNRTPLLVAAIAVTIGLTIQLLNLGLNVAYRFIDPRLRERL